MGQRCTTEAGTETLASHRDPQDITIDRVVLHETDIKDCDAFFTRASTSINQVVEMNNDLAGCIDQIKQDSALLQGAVGIDIVKAKNQIKLHLVEWKAGNEARTLVTDYAFEAYIKDDPVLQQATAGLIYALGRVNGSLGKPSTSPTEWDISRGKLKISKPGMQDDELQLFEAALFRLRLLLQEKVQAPGLKGAMEALQKALAAAGKQCKPTANVSQDGAVGIIYLSDDHQKVDITKEHLPSRVKQLTESLRELEKVSQQAVKVLPPLNDRVSELADEATALPTKLRDMENTLPRQEYNTAKAKAKTNIKTIGQARELTRKTAAEFSNARRQLQLATSA